MANLGANLEYIWERSVKVFPILENSVRHSIYLYLTRENNHCFFFLIFFISAKHQIPWMPVRLVARIVRCVGNRFEIHYRRMGSIGYRRKYL